MGEGGIIRDNKGTWIVGFTKFMGKGSIVLAKMWALFLGIKTASSLGRKNIEIETDAFVASDLLLYNRNAGRMSVVRC